MPHLQLSQVTDVAVTQLILREGSCTAAAATTAGTVQRGAPPQPHWRSSTALVVTRGAHLCDKVHDTRLCGNTQGPPHSQSVELTVPYQRRNVHV